MMDYLLLLLLKKMLKCKVTYRRILFGAMTGACFTCFIVVLPIPYAMIKFVLFHTLVNTFMIRVGLKIKHVRQFVKAYFLLYIGSFLLGGVLLAFSQYVSIGSLFFIIATSGYHIVSKIWDYIVSIQQQDCYQCEVDLYFQEKIYRVQAIIDTGNRLRDPYTNQPVNILDRKIARTFLGEEKMSNIHYIPYHSIGKQEGVLMAVQIERMRIYREEEYWIEKPLLGISETMISADGEYQMILNPNLF